MYSIIEAVPLEFETFKLGREGWPVIACQIAINSHFATPPLTLDGVFGPHTQQAAKEVQAACHVTVDGVLGPESQEAFVKAKCKHAEKSTTPAGLLAGLCNIESSYSWPCVSPLNSNGTHDYGVTQWSLANPDTAQLRAAFNPDTSAHTLAGEVRGFRNAFLGMSAVGSGQRAWELAALAHNWPAAAYALAEGNAAWLDQPEAWLTAKGFPSGTAYCNHYIAVATAQVTSWSV